MSQPFPSSSPLQAIARLIADGQVTTAVSKTISLHEAGQAHELSQAGHGRGRIVLRIAG